MSVTIGSNVASLNAQRRLSESAGVLSQVYERLASGQRMNRASDDAAGLSIASALNAKFRIQTRATANINDGLSLLQIADGTLSEVANVLTRMIELAEQAANGSYSSTQRRALDDEFKQLSIELRRVGSSASFNGLAVLQGERTSRAATRIATTGGSGAAAYAVSDDGHYALYKTSDSAANVYRKDLRTGDTVLVPAGSAPAINSADHVKVLNNGDVFYSALNNGPLGLVWDVFKWSSGAASVTQLTNSQHVLEFSTFDVSADGSKNI